MYRGGGFADSRDGRLPESVAIQVEVADELDRREVERETRRAVERVRELEESSIRASIVLAQDRGELVDIRQAYRSGGVGRTVSEARAYFAAQQDLEDARAELLERAEFERWKREQQDGTWADTSAPSEAEVVEAEQTAARARKYRAENDLIAVARGLARFDRTGRE
jgi:hypothetical protein